jgi:hypothetical protein
MQDILLSIDRQVQKEVICDLSMELSWTEASLTTHFLKILAMRSFFRHSDRCVIFQDRRREIMFWEPRELSFVLHLVLNCHGHCTKRGMPIYIILQHTLHCICQTLFLVGYMNFDQRNLISKLCFQIREWTHFCDDISSTDDRLSCDSKYRKHWI